MTCIIGLVQDGKVYMGGDSAGVAGYSMSVRADEKVYRNSGLLMGFTTSFRMGQLLRYSFIPPERLPSEEPDKYMVTRFVDSVRECLKKGGWAAKKDEAEHGGTFLVGYQGSLYCIEGSYQVAKQVDSVPCRRLR